MYRRNLALALTALLCACGSDIDKKGGSPNNANNASNATNNANNTVGVNNTIANNISNNHTSGTNNGTSGTNNGTTGTNNGTSGTNNGTSGTNNGTNNTNNMPMSCQPNSCTGFQFCEQDSGTCQPGCERDEQCGGNFFCNIDNACECPEGDEFLACGAMCSPCPTQNVLDVDCNDVDECVASACTDGYEPCATGCCAVTPPRMWTEEVIDDIETWSLDLAISDNDTLNVSYGDYVNFDLKHAVRRINGWMVSTVDSMGTTGVQSAIAVTTLGQPFIVYQDSTANRLNFTAQIAGVWTPPQAVSSVGPGYGSDIVRSASNQPYVSYYTNGGELIFATRNAASTGWDRTVVDATNAGNSAIARDGSAIYITYHDTLTDDLRIASGTANGVWSTEVVDATGRVGFESSIAVDSGGQLHIVYLDLTSNTNVVLKYAVGTLGTWFTSVLDSGDAGEYATIALDSQDRPHVVYRDFGVGGLKYAHRAANTWDVDTIDPSVDAGWYSRVVVDSNDEPHIVHIDLGRNELIYLR